MPWVRLDDRFPSHRKVALLSDRAFRLYISALCWASENLTEGKILDRELPLVARGVRGAKRTATELEEAGLWDRIADGWMVHDYLEYNPDRARVKADREANAARQKAFRERKKAEREAKRAAEEAERDANRNGVTPRTSGTENDTTATRRRHDGDTTTARRQSENREESQVAAIRNGVSNGPPSPPPSRTTSPDGDVAASSDPPPRTGGIPDRLEPLRTALAAAGLGAVAWDIKKITDWERIRRQMDRLGVDVMVRSAATAARNRGEPDSVTAWIGRWESLADPQPQAEPASQPAPGGQVVPINASRQQQQTDDMFDRAMARAKARMQQESS